MQPFLIAPFATGLDTDLEPWLLPQDAFSSIINGHIHHGVIEKRQGFRELAKIPHCITISASTAANPAVFSVASTTPLTDGDTVQLNYLAGGTWATLNNTQYIIRDKDTFGANTFTLDTIAGADVDGAALGVYTASSGCVGYYPGLRVMGLWRYVDSDNVKQLLAFDTERAAVYNTVSELFDPLDANDIFNSGSNPNINYVTAGNWASTASSNSSPLYRLYFTNGKSNNGGATDGIRVYDRSISTSETGKFNPFINSTAGAGGIEIRGAKLIFPMRQRLVLLHTFEGAEKFPQRARWSQAQNPDGTTVGGYPLTFALDTWNDNAAGAGGFVDAPTGEQIISAQFVQDQLIVYFTESVWTLRPTSDPALPFRWDRINSFRACDSKMSTAGFDRYVTAFGVRGITSTDGVETTRFDERIEKFVQNDINAKSFEKVFSRRSFASRRLWTLYPQGTSEESDHALIFDKESGAFSKYKIDMNVLGYGGVAKDFSLSDFPDSDDGKGTPIYLNGPDGPGTPGDPGDDRLDDYVFNEGADIFIGGDRSGGVQILETDGSDKDASIDFSLESAAWNPWISEGSKSKLGYLDVFVDTHPHTDVTYKFYKDNDDGYDKPYAIVDSDLLPNLREIAEIVTVTKADPAQVTANLHGLSTGDVIYIYKVGGMFQINGGPYTITFVDDNRFTLDGIDSTTFSDFGSGGVITELPFERTKTWKRIYAGGSGYQHKVRIFSNGADRPLRIHAFMPWFKKTGRRTI